MNLRAFSRWPGLSAGPVGVLSPLAGDMSSTGADLRQLVAELEKKIASQNKIIDDLRKQLRTAKAAPPAARQLHQNKKSKPTNEHAEAAAATTSVVPTQPLPPPGTKRQISEILSSSDASIDEEMIEKKSHGNQKPPPITVHRIGDFPAFSALVIKDGPSDNPTTTKTLANGNVKVLTHTDDEYWRVIKLLRESKYHYHHFQLKSEKPFRVVIRGLNPATTIQEIKDGLETIGHTVRSANNISYRKKNGVLTNR